MSGVLVAYHMPLINNIYDLISLYQIGEGNKEERIAIRRIQEIKVTIGLQLRLIVPLIGVDEDGEYIIRLEHSQSGVCSESIKARKFVESLT